MSRKVSKLRQEQRVDHPFGPLYDENSRVLILGTMASPKSRENRFWKVMSLVLGEELPVDNEGKRTLLLKNRIALWDVIQSCSIKNADDASIKDPIANDLSVIFSEAKIQAVFSTGKKAESLYRKHCMNCEEDIDIQYLPSTSPANQGNYSLDDLVEYYKVILSYLK